MQEDRYFMPNIAISESATPGSIAPGIIFHPHTIDRLTISPAQHDEFEDRSFAKRYSIQSLLSRGGFGITFLARDNYLPGHPLCVIKQFAPMCTDAKLIEIAAKQFDLEALSLSRLGSHAQIPTLLDYFKIGSNCYLVEEYIPGSVLSQLVTSKGCLTEVAIEKFLTQMLQVLEYIHSQQLIHRDIKPQNIIWCQTDHRFVLVDFGAIKDICPATATPEYDRAIGTPGFAAPEQLINYPVYASDLYALGMTCIYLMTGKEPSSLPTDLRTGELRWSDEIDISNGLIEIINKMTQIAVVDRYKSATQVLTALANRSIRAKLRTYLDQKYAVAKSEQRGSFADYPAVVQWALGLE
jgi:serine/threonine protein kinase